MSIGTLGSRMGQEEEQLGDILLQSILIGLREVSDRRRFLPERIVQDLVSPESRTTNLCTFLEFFRFIATSVEESLGRPHLLLKSVQRFSRILARHLSPAKNKSRGQCCNQQPDTYTQSG